MTRHWLAVVFVLGLLTLPEFGYSPLASDGFEPGATPRVATSLSLSDTLRSSTEAGTPLILSLPAKLQGTPVTRYTVLQGPSLSGVAGRSFTWIPKGFDPGTYNVALRAQHADAPADTLVLQIKVES